MEFRRVGRSGLAVSVVGLGTNNLGMKLDDEQSREVVHAAFDSGITLFDTADSYGQSEERLGRLLEGHRDDVIIATKFGSDVRRRGLSDGEDWGARGSRRYIRRAVEASLRRLRTDWIDLYQLHQPDPSTPLEETLSALTDLVREGKVRYLGSSNFPGWLIAHAHWTAKARRIEHFVSAQNEYSWLAREAEREVIPAVQAYGIGLLPYFPLASGKLSGKYRRGETPPPRSRVASWGMKISDREFGLIESLSAFAAERGVELLDVAIGGLAAQPPVASVIAGATSREQVERNVQAGEWMPSPEDLAEILKITGELLP